MSNVTINGGSLDVAGNSDYAPTPTNFTSSANTSLIRSGLGITTLAGNLAFAGSSVGVVSGGLAIDHTANNSAKLSASPTLMLGSGTMSLLGNDSAIAAETFNAVNLLGAGRITVATGSNQNASVNLGAISAAGGSTLNVTLNNVGSGTASISTTTPNGIIGLSGGNAILGGYAVVNGTDWATTGTGGGPFNITAIPASAYSSDSKSGAWSSTLLNSVTASSTLTPSSTTAALRFNYPTAATLAMSGTNAIVSGGILVTPNVGANNLTITGGTIAATNGAPLYVQQYNTAGNLTIASTLANTVRTVTVAPTFSNASTQVTVATAGLYPGMTVSGTGIASSARILTINGSNSLTLTLATTASSSGNAIFTGGTVFVKSGPGKAVLSSAANALNGGIILNEGTLDVSTALNLGPTTNPIYFNGGTLHETGSINDGSSGHPWLLGPAGGTINVDSGFTATKYGNSIFGSGNLIKTGSGILSMSTNATTWSGSIFVNQGNLRETGSYLTSLSGMTVADGGRFWIYDTGSATYSFASGAALTLNGSGLSSTISSSASLGAFGLVPQYSTSAAPVTTFSNPVYLATDSMLASQLGGSSGTTTLILSGPISGPGNLIKGGDGILQISSANNIYGGPSSTTTVLMGTLKLAAANALPVATNLVIGDATANTSGMVNLNGQTQVVASLSTSGNGSSNGIVSSSGTTGVLTLNYQGSTPMVYTGAMGLSSTDSNFAFATTGSGVVVLAGNNTYTQGTTIGHGATLQLGNGFGSGSIIGNVSNNGSLIFAAAGVSGGVISGSGSIAQTQGTVSLTGSNIYTGGTFIQNGTLVASGGTNRLPVATTVTLGDLTNNSNYGVLQLGDNSGPVNQTLAGLSTSGTNPNNAIIGGNNDGNSTLTVNLASNSIYSGALGGYGSASKLALVKEGAAKLTLTGASNYVGPTIVNGGVLEVGSATALSVTSAVTVNLPGTLRISGNTLSVASIAGDGTVENANAAAGLLITGADNTDTTFSGLLRDGTGMGKFGLTKIGSGVLTLAGSNTYSGPTTVNAGTLHLIGQTNQASPFSVSNGAALSVSTASNTAILGSTLVLGAAPSDTMALNFDIQGAWSHSVPMLAVSGAITTNGITTINLTSAAPPSVGTYPLINYSGLISGSGFAGFTKGSLVSSRIEASLQNDVSNNMLLLNVTVSDSPKWTGAIDGKWDSATQNWVLLGSGSATSYFKGDNVLFDDTATGTTSVSILSPVTPNSITFNNTSHTYTLSGSAITGHGSLALTGSGLLVLATDNDYTGGTTISAGTLQLGSGGISGSVTGNVTNNGTLVVNRSDNPTIAGSISGSGRLVHGGSGLTTLLADNTYSGGTTISGGTLQVGAGGNSGSIAGDIVNNSALAFSRSGIVNYNGTISGPGTVTQAGPGTLVFNGNHSYSGLTTIGGGTLQIGSGGTTGRILGDVTFPQYANAAIVFARSDEVTYSGMVSGDGKLVQQGPGNLILTGTNTHNLGTQFSGGTVTVASDFNLGAAGKDLIFNGGSLRAAAPLDLSAAGSPRSIVLGVGDNAIDTNGFDVYLPGQVQGNGNLIKNGAGTLTLTNIYNWYANAAGSSFTVNGGAVAFGSNGAVPTLLLALNGGTLQAISDMGATGNPTVASGTEFSTNIQVGPNGATIDTGSHWFTTLGQMKGDVGSTLTKTGAGTWYVRFGMGGTFNGNLHIQAGTVLDDYTGLAGGNTDAISDSTVVTVDAGASFDDSWGNGENLGGIAGAGDIIMANTKTLALKKNVSTTFSGRIIAAANSVPSPGGPVAFNQDGGGSITLTSNASDFGGLTTITSGTIIVSASVLPNQTGPLGLANSEIRVGTTSGSSNAALLADAAGVEIGRDVRLQSGNSGVSTIGGLNTSGTVTYSGITYLGNNSAIARPLTLTATDGGTVVFSGPLRRADNAIGSTDAVTKTGAGTVVLAAANNTYSGSTFIQNGTLVAAGGDNTLPVTTSVSLGDAFNDSGVLQVGDATGPVYQTIAGLSIVGSGTGNRVVGGYASASSTLALNTSSDGTFGGRLGGATASENSLGFTKSGSGQLTLTGANSYLGATTVNGGTLVAGSATALGVNSAVTVASGATVRLGGNSLTVGSLAGSGTVENANAAAAELTIGSDNNSTQFTGLLQNGSGGGYLSLRKMGNGTLTVGGTQTYAGATTVNAGVFQLQGAASLASGLTVNHAAGLSVLDTSTPEPVNLTSTLTFGSSLADATSLNFNLQGGWSTSTPLLFAGGAVTANGTTTINLASSSLPTVGNYTLLDYSSNLGGRGFAGFVLGSLPSPRMVASLINDTVNTNLVLVVSAIDSSKWTGVSNSIWDVNTTSNWKLVAANSTTKYLQGDNVQFDDSGANNAISLVGTLTPSNVQFNNDSKSYSLNGSGKISGNTALVKGGSALLAINTDNDYLGGTFVNGGTLQLGSGGSTGSIAGNIVNNAMLVFNRSNTISYSGVIDGVGAVKQNGSGLLSILGNNTYSGLTTVSSGSLQIGNGGLSGAISGDILNSSTVIFNRGNTTLYAGAISGVGAVVQQGAGTTILTGNNTYSGGTSIYNGTLQIGNGGDSGSLTGDVQNNGALIVNRLGELAFAGEISGSGSLDKQGAGTLTLTKNSSYTGGTSITSGILQLGIGGTSGGIVGNVTIGGTLAVNRSDNVTLDGLLTGPGGVAQNGSGITTLTGANSYSGGTSISGGTVAVSSNQNLGNSGVSLNGGTIQLLADFDNLAVPNTAFTKAIAIGINGGTIDTNGHYMALNANVTNDVGAALNKNGAGTLYLQKGLAATGFNGDYFNVNGGTVTTAKNNVLGNSTVLAVAAGATFDDSQGDGEDLGQISGAGDIIIASTGTIALKAPAPATVFSGRLRGTSTSNFTVDGGATITLSGSDSNYGGTTKVTNGALKVAASALPEQNGALGNAFSEVQVGGSSNAILLADAAGVEIGRDVRVLSGVGASVLGGDNVSGSTRFTGTITLGSDNGSSKPLILTAAAGGIVEIAGPIVRGTLVSGTSDSLTKIGDGTLILSNATNHYQGGLNVEAGTVVLTTAGALPDGSSLTVGAGGILVFDPSFSSNVVSGGVIAADVAVGVATVPEPGTLVLLAVGAALVAFASRRRRKN